MSILSRGGHQKVMSAECVNLLARFVRIARQEDSVDIYLQDENLMAKVSIIAKQTDNQELKAIYKRLTKVLDEEGNQTTEGNQTAKAGSEAIPKEAQSQLKKMVRLLGFR